MLRFLLPKDKSAEGPAQRGSSLKIRAEDGLDVLVGDSACSFSTATLGKPSFPGGVSEGCVRGVLQNGMSEWCLIWVFQRCFRECFKPLAGFPERFCVLYPGGTFVKVRLPEGQIGRGTSTERFLGEISAEVASMPLWATRRVHFQRRRWEHLVSGGVFQRGVSDPLA